MQHLRGVIAVILALLLSSMAANAQTCAFGRDFIKQGLIDGLSVPPGLQDIDIGPFSNGRTYRLQLEYLNTGARIQVIRDSDPLCVSVDRTDASRASLTVDAFEICGQHGGCERLPTYLDHLFQSTTVAQMDLFEGGDPALQRQLSNWCLDEAYARQWLARIEQIMFVIQTHEIGHVILHPDMDITVTREAEADGFAAAFIEHADLPYAAGAAVFTSQVETGRNFAPGRTHPQAECRVEAFGLGLAEWYARRPGLTAPRRFAPRAASSDLEGLDHFLPTNPAVCDPYAEGFHQGVTLAVGLLTPETSITFRTEETGRRCTAMTTP